STFDQHRNAPAKLDDLCVANPIRREDHHLVSLVYDTHEGVSDGVLRSDGDNNIFSFRLLDGVFFSEFFGDSLSQILIPSYRRVGEVFSFVDRSLSCLLDMLGSLEIWLSQTQTNNVNALRFQFPGFFCHGKGG